ncbi:hypothetical protein AVEN_56989-1, partial [Araneus ventricosus]
LLARTADRTPKTFVLQGDRSQSIHTSPSSKRSPYIVSPGRPWRHMESSSTIKRISSPNRDIEKIPAPLRSQISSTNLSPRSGPQNRLQPVSHTYRCKTLYPTIRLTLLGSDFPSL